MVASTIRKLTLCKIGLCPFSPASDNHACWGECTICGKRSGYVTRKAIRAYMDLEDAARSIVWPQEKPGTP